MLTSNPGLGVAQRTCTLVGENEMAVEPPTRLNVSVCDGSDVGVGGGVVAVGAGVGG